MLRLEKRPRRGKLPKMSHAAARGRDGQVRPLLAAVHLVKEKGHLILAATNSYIYARHTLEALGPGDFETAVEGPIPPMAMKHIEKGVGFEPGEDSVRVGAARYDRVLTDDGATVSDYGEKVQVPPDWNKVKPGPPERPLRVALNVQHLVNAAAALGDDGIELEFDLEKADGEVGLLKYNKPIHVRPINRDDGEALLMPIRHP